MENNDFINDYLSQPGANDPASHVARAKLKDEFFSLYEISFGRAEERIVSDIEALFSDRLDHEFREPTLLKTDDRSSIVPYAIDLLKTDMENKYVSLRKDGKTV